MQVGARRHLIFATPEKFKYLAHSKRWYMDATFHVVKAPFTQLFSVHSFLHQDGETKQVPLAFILMSGKRAVDYQGVLTALIDRLPREPRVEEVILDYEAAMWKAVRQVIPDATIKGCAFDWGQAVWRKAQESELQVAYQEDKDIFNFIRKLLALPFLPAEHITDMFEHLQGKAGSAQLRDLTSHIEDTWIIGLWKPKHWSVFKQSDLMTYVY